jgi:Tol biopolymer transport system component
MPTMRFTVPPPEKNFFGEGFALSPDGKSIVFVARNDSGIASLWVRSLDGLEPRQLSGTDGAASPFWSPDARSIGFFSNGKLRKVDAAGGPTQSLADASADPRGGA